MFIKISSVAITGLETIEVGVEVNLVKSKLPSFNIVGLPAKTVNESKERVRAAVRNSAVSFPKESIVVNLAPADVPKEGSCYDLPIAVGLLSLSMNLRPLESSLFFGELSLDGSLKHTKGALLLALFAKENGFSNVFIPYQSANEAAVVKGINVYPIKNLQELIEHIIRKREISPASYYKKGQKMFTYFDVGEVLGQETAKRALEIAAAGGHNLFMIGSPGSGKTMLARAFPSILPSLSEEESLEVTKIYSISGYIPPKGSLIENRPFRAPHHSISAVGMIGGGIKPRPGEVTLAHRGVLFLDELNEFQRPVLESLRQPMEDGFVSISRNRERVVYPSSHTLIASANPCPCGYRNHLKKECSCTEREVENYHKRVSGPILDRIDMHIEVPDVETEKLSSSSSYRESVESSEVVKKRVDRAREFQRKRFQGERVVLNAEMRNKEIEKLGRLSKEAERILISASKVLHLSARSYYKIIKLGRTIADIDCCEDILPVHIKEALQYRANERK